MQIKRAGKKDINSIFKILQANNRWLIKKGFIHWEGFYKKEKIKESLKDDEIYLLLVNKNPSGTITITDKEPEIYKSNIVKFHKKLNGKKIYLKGLAILPKFHKKGFGSKLMIFAEKKAKEKKANYVVLDFLSSYKELKKFYKKRGYRLAGKIKGEKGSIYFKTIRQTF